MPLIRFGYFHTSSPDWEWVVQLDASKEYLLCQVNKEKSFKKTKQTTKTTWPGLL